MVEHPVPSLIRKRWPWLVGIAGALAGAILLVVLIVPPRMGSWERIRREGVIRIGYAVEAPYAFLDARGEPTGLEVDVARSVAANLKIPGMDWIQTDFALLLSELEEGRFDAVAAGVFITPERAKRALFSEPTFRVRQALLVRAGNPRRLHAYEDMRGNEGTRIAVLHGSIEEGMVRDMGVPRDRVIVVPDVLTGRTAVETGLADGLALSLPTVRNMALRQMLGLTEAAEPFAQPSRPGVRFMGYGAVVFRKTDHSLCREWNRGLKAFIGSEEHLRLLVRYGLTTADLPGNVTTSTILASGAE